MSKNPAEEPVEEPEYNEEEGEESDDYEDIEVRHLPSSPPRSCRLTVSDSESRMKRQKRPGRTTKARKAQRARYAHIPDRFRRTLVLIRLRFLPHEGRAAAI